MIQTLNCTKVKLRPEETELKGSWIFNGASMDVDETTQRIESLISEYLVEISIDDSGWSKLFQDPNDKRYWELTYPASENHGGGFPLLKNLPQQEAKKKYHLQDNM